MADEMEGNSPRSTSEATPPPVDSPEMVSQPSPPEEQRVSSSTDRQPPEVAIPDEQRIGSTSRRGPNEGAGPSRRLSALERLLLSSDEAGAVEGSSGVLSQNSAPLHEPENQTEPDALPYAALRRYLEAPPLIIHSEAQSALIHASVYGAAVESSLVQSTFGPARVQEAVGGGQKEAIRLKLFDSPGVQRRGSESTSTE